ncbi:MAG: hypothetical protein AAFY76_16240 [Cyanobacteria bacterium J06649_11]
MLPYPAYERSIENLCWLITISANRSKCDNGQFSEYQYVDGGDIQLMLILYRLLMLMKDAAGDPKYIVSYCDDVATDHVAPLVLSDWVVVWVVDAQT